MTGKQLDVSQRTAGLTITSTHGEHHRARRALIRIAELGGLLLHLGVILIWDCSGHSRWGVGGASRSER
ncbi:MAG: hypothetical protein ABSE84_29590 [Isosphaeraceae bacterium]